MNKPIILPLAKLLKENGFDGKVTSHYRDGELIYNGSPYNFNDPEEQKLWSIELYSAPTVSDVVVWIKDNFGIWISVTGEVSGETWYPRVSIITNDGWKNMDLRDKVNGIFNLLRTYWLYTHTEAYERAIELVLITKWDGKFPNK